MHNVGGCPTNSHSIVNDENISFSNEERKGMPSSSLKFRILHKCNFLSKTNPIICISACQPLIRDWHIPQFGHSCSPGSAFTYIQSYRRSSELV